MKVPAVYIVKNVSKFEKLNDICEMKTLVH